LEIETNPPRVQQGNKEAANGNGQKSTGPTEPIEKDMKTGDAVDFLIPAELLE